MDNIVEETQPVLCPACKKNYLHPNLVMNSLSRRDNQTYICPQCGDREAMEDYEKSLKQRQGKVHESTPKD
jgi:transposase-like protein